MFTFKRDSLPDSGDYPRLLQHGGGGAADQRPVPCDVLGEYF